MIYLISLLALILRLINLNQSLWLDEAITAQAVKNNSFVGLITKFSPGDFHPPLYYLFLKLWTVFFGYSEIALRLPSLVFGVVTVFFVFKIGESLISRRIGLIAALFLAVNPLAVYYSQEARMYSLATMLVTACVWFLIKKKMLLYILFLTLALYTDYVPYLMLPVFIFFSRFTILSAIFILPLFPLILGQLSTGFGVSTSWGDLLGRTNIKNLLLVPVKFIFGRVSFDNKILYAGVVAPVSGIYLYIVSAARNKILWLWLVVPLLLGALISFKIPIFSYFRFLFVLPALIILLATGCKNRGPIIFVSLVSLLSLMYFNINPKFQREDWRGAALYMNKQPGLAIMPSLAQDAPISYYSSTQSVLDKDSLAMVKGSPVYLFRYVQEIFDPKDSAESYLTARGYQKVEERDFNGVVVWKYIL